MMYRADISSALKKAEWRQTLEEVVLTRSLHCYCHTFFPETFCSECLCEPLLLSIDVCKGIFGKVWQKSSKSRKSFDVVVCCYNIRLYLQWPKSSQPRNNQNFHFWFYFESSTFNSIQVCSFCQISNCETLHFEFWPKNIG